MKNVCFFFLGTCILVKVCIEVRGDVGFYVVGVIGICEKCVY